MEYFKFDVTTLPNIFLTGKVYVPEKNCHFTRTPNEHVLYFVTKGSMIITENNITYKLKKGDVLILDPSHKHTGIPCDSEIEYLYIHFNCQSMQIINSQKKNLQEEMLHNKINYASPDTLIIPKYINLDSQFGIFENLIYLLVCDFQCKADFYKTQASIRLIELFIKMSKILFYEDSQNIDKNQIVIKIINFIHENYNKNICSKDIEQFFNMNFDYLNRIFKTKTNTTIINYANKYRINESKKLLSTGLYSVKQTANLLGFSNEFYFSRVYKKYEGVSPSKKKVTQNPVPCDL